MRLLYLLTTLGRNSFIRKVVSRLMKMIEVESQPGRGNRNCYSPKFSKSCLVVVRCNKSQSCPPENSTQLQPFCPPRKYQPVATLDWNVLNLQMPWEDGSDSYIDYQRTDYGILERLLQIWEICQNYLNNSTQCWNLSSTPGDNDFAARVWVKTFLLLKKKS